MDKVLLLSSGRNLESSLRALAKAGYLNCKYLALGALSPGDVQLLAQKRIEKVSVVFSDFEREQFLKAYVDLVGQLNSEQNSLLWWATDMASKNRFTSQLSALLQKFWTASKVIKEGRCDCLIILGVPWVLRASLKKLIDPSVHIRSFMSCFTCGFVGAKALGFKIISIKWNGIKALYRIYYARKYFSSFLKSDFSAPYYVIKSFVYHGSFRQDGTYQDACFGDLPEFLAKKSKVLILATALVNYKRCLQQMKNCRSQGIVPWELFLSFQDVWFWSFRYLLFRVKLKQQLSFLGSDVSDIVKKELLRTGCKIQLPQLFHYAASQRLAQRISMKTFLMTCENNPWEKMCLLAIRSVSFQTKILGYVQSVVPQASANMFLSLEEQKVAPLPDQILTTGKEPKRIMEQYGHYKGDQVAVSCGLRFQYLMRKPLSERRPIRRVLLALEGIPEVSAMVDYVLRELKDNTKYEVVIRTHPVLPWSYFERKYGYSLQGLDHVHVSQEVSLDKDIQDADVLMYWGTTVALEALSVGKSVIHFDMGFILSFDPLFECRALKWTICEKDSLVAKLKEIEQLDSSEFKRQQIEARNYLQDYFGPIEDTVLNKFMAV